MIRIFSILSIITVLLSLLIGGGVYWMSVSDVKQSKQRTTEVLAQGLALSISAKTNTLQKTVEKMAVTNEVIAAIESQNPQQMQQTALMLDQFMPSVMKIRILPADVTELDKSSIPHMGNADLIMALETLTKKQRPVLQGQGKNRHLAITAAIVKDNEAIGIILASLKYDFLQSILNTAQGKNSVLELKQQKTSIAKIGSAAEDLVLDQQVQVAKTSWNIHYSSAATASLFSSTFIAGIISIPTLIICLAFFIAYRNMSNTLRQDQGTILKALKDIMSGKTVGNYPVALDEMKTLISTLVQYKRVIDNKGKDLSETPADDDFFDEPDGVSFLDMDLDDDEQKTSTVIPSTPISLPETTSIDFPDLSVVTAEIDSKKKVNSTIYRAYDIRGIVNQTLTSDIVFNIAQAVASEAKEKNINTIVIGRDGRLSSPALSESLAKGIISTGVNVLDIGLVPSPLVYFVAQHTEGRSAVVVTASHNPAEYNGLKLIIDGETLAADRIQQIKQRVDEKNYVTGPTGSIDKNDMFINEYIGIIADDIHLVRPMTVVVDCGNGAAGELAPTLLRTLGCEVIELFCDIDGNFPNHHPDPTNPDNLKDLITAVQHYKADLGLAFDGDGDRLGVIDAKGKIIWADRQLMLFAQDVLKNKPGAEIIFDVKSSRHLQEHIIKHGGRPLMWKTGHSFMKAKIKETAAALAGEMSGHIFFNDRWFGFDDALYAASRLIGLLSADTRSSDEVFADLPESVSTPEIYIELNEGENFLLMDQILANASFNDAKIITIDGIRANFADGWGLVRASNTMPALALRFEADDIKALNRIQAQFKDLLIQLKADINIPF